MLLSDYDGAWKDLLHRRLREVLGCFFPEIASTLDWSRPPEFLEQELRQILVDISTGDKRVDLLIRVSSLQGLPQTLFLHLEVQSGYDRDFESRMCTMFHAIRQACGKEVVSLAILADLHPGWRPSEYRWALLGCETIFRFPCCKILEVLPELEGNYSLPALAAKAQIAALQTTGDGSVRRQARWKLTRALYEQGYTKEAVAEAYRLIAWMMRLPKQEALIFRNQLIDFERKKNMPYITDTEEIALEQGMEQGMERGMERGLGEGLLKQGRQSVLEALEVRFGEVPTSAREKILAIQSAEELSRLLRQAILASDLETFSLSLEV